MVILPTKSRVCTIYEEVSEEGVGKPRDPRNLALAPFELSKILPSALMPSEDLQDLRDPNNNLCSLSLA
jgi:hypothetical protein